ncbi:MAG: hypothetical protein KKF12_12230 [Proteobacteria bacterium]|nr:hypothetical protein [Desulfobacula sp.]MBU3951012.1 hypothetical protein [Pseudomonadota bacterium]MBU4131580.1 hypothetical protein [Pseudomonadota bacterium]
MDTKEMPGCCGGETGQDRKQGGEPELIQICLMSRVKCQVIKTLLPSEIAMIKSKAPLRPPKLDLTPESISLFRTIFKAIEHAG